MPNWLKNAIKNVSTDCVVFGFENSTLEVLLYKRARNPSKGMWALPGGFLSKGELIEEAARRILKQTTGISDIYLEQVAVFDQIDRFPSWRVFTISYYALVSPENYKLISSDTYTIEAKWFDIKKLPTLAWDHRYIVEVAKKSLEARYLVNLLGLSY
ncbi:MAG: NUDIX hydrolase [Ignavibacteria bacterium]|jgi:ADP-ribose pyrophosphatase YjhB (NUDIX family)